jgi:hypothetical protein
MAFRLFYKISLPFCLYACGAQRTEFVGWLLTLYGDVVLVVALHLPLHHYGPNFAGVVCLSPSFWAGSECEVQPDSMTRYEEFLIAARAALLEFNNEIDRLAAEAADICGSPDSSAFVSALVTISGYICSALNALIDLRAAFQCQTWLPIYYNTVYNAMCFNGTDGVWALAASQFIVVFMACVIMTFRAVFWDLEVSEESNVDIDGEGGDRSEQGGDVLAAPVGVVEEDYGTEEPKYTGGSSGTGLVSAKAY